LRRQWKRRATREKACRRVVVEHAHTLGCWGANPCAAIITISWQLTAVCHLPTYARRQRPCPHSLHRCTAACPPNIASGGSVLGSSSPLALGDEASLRQRARAVAQQLHEWGVSQLFVVGGEGGQTLGSGGARSVRRWRAVGQAACEGRVLRTSSSICPETSGRATEQGWRARGGGEPEVRGQAGIRATAW
jgi:hypothetical protein